MIKFKTTIYFRDDKKKVFDCVQRPIINPDYVIVDTSHSDYEYIPKEAIQSIKVKEYWEQNEPQKNTK